jgi:hypothetical protein
MPLLHRADALDLLKPELALIMFTHSVLTPKETQHCSITKINWVMLFREVIAV